MNRTEFRFAVRPLPFLDAQASNPGGVLELRARPTRRLLVWHPDAIEHIFRRDRQMCHRASRTMSPILGSRSLLWADGDRHLAYRRMLAPPLRGRRLALRHPAIADTVSAAVGALVRGTTFSLPEWTRAVTLRIIGQIVFGESDVELLHGFTNWITGELGSRRRTLVHRYLGRGASRSNADLDARLLSAAGGARPPALAALLLAGDTTLGALEDGELRDQLVSLLFAGHETTASATAWTLYWLDRHDGLRGDLVAELAATTDSGADATQVPLLHAVVQESLRLSPPATLAGNRVPVADDELLGAPLPAGTVLMPSIYLAHRQPDLFPQPRRFDPNRFLDKTVERTASAGYLPFGGGTRRCLGSELAMLEIRMIVAAVLRQRRMRCVNPEAGIAQPRGHAMAPSPRLRMMVVA
ncbi:MAG: cytochrome P450 [Kutzneria sp.]|nr:cytochrome P450 [Kutzneria sp.]